MNDSATPPIPRLERRPDQLRALIITRHYTRHAEGAVLSAFGDTKVLCTASVLAKVPPHKKGSGEGGRFMGVVREDGGAIPGGSTVSAHLRGNWGAGVELRPGRPYY